MLSRKIRYCQRSHRSVCKEKKTLCIHSLFSHTRVLYTFCCSARYKPQDSPRRVQRPRADQGAINAAQAQIVHPPAAEPALQPDQPQNSPP